MKKELQQKLFQKYPEIFSHTTAETTGHPVGLWGIECGDGWYQLIDSLCGTIQHYLDRVNNRRARDAHAAPRHDEKVPQVVASQVKEKFGGLRFYYDGGDEHISGAVSMAESMSFTTCDVCGSPGEQVSGHYIRILCSTHQQGRS